MDAYAHIDAYLDNDLTAAEREAFARAMQEDAGLRKTVRRQQRLRAELALRGNDDRHRELMAAARSAHPLRKPRRATRWWAVAALLLVALSATWLLWPTNPAPRELAERYGQLNAPSSVLPVNEGYQLRSGSAPASTDERRTDPVNYARYLNRADTVPAKALRAYQSLPDSLLTDSLRFETALLHLRLDQPAPALALLDRLNTPHGGGVYWYRALAYLRLGEVEGARTQVQKLLSMSRDGGYQSDARRLLTELDGEKTPE